MNEEQQKAVNNLKNYIDNDYFYKGIKKVDSDFDEFCYNHCKDIATLLDMIEKDDFTDYLMNREDNIKCLEKK